MWFSQLGNVQWWTKKSGDGGGMWNMKQMTKIKNGLEQIEQKGGSSNLANGTLSITLFLQYSFENFARKKCAYFPKSSFKCNWHRHQDILKC